MATILVLEDDRVSQRLLKLILEKEGHTVLCAENGEEAWELLQTALLPQVLILDHQLRGGKGIDFLNNFQLNPLYEQTPTIVCITAPNRSIVMKFAGSKVQSILAKPYEPVKVINEVNKALMQDPYANLFESEESFCQRMNLTPEIYRDMMGVTIIELDQNLKDIQQALEYKHWSFLKDHLVRLTSLGASLGFNVLARFAQKLMNSLNHQNNTQEILKEAPKILNLIHKVFQARMNLNNNSEVAAPVVEENVNQALPETNTVTT